MKKSQKHFSALTLDNYVPGPGASSADLDEARRLLRPDKNGKRAATPLPAAHLSLSPQTSLIDADRPDWARGVHVTRRLGPFVGDGGLPAWVNVTSIVKLTPVYRLVNGQKQILAYVPFSSLLVLPKGQTTLALPAGTLRLALAQLVPAQTGNLFAATRIKSGTLTSNLPLTISGQGIKLANGATADLTIALDPQPATAGGDTQIAPDAIAAAVTLPASATFHFGATTCQVTSLAALQGTLYGTTVALTYQGAAPAYFASGEIKECLIPCSASVPDFTYANVASDVFRPAGTPTITQAAWSLPVAADSGSNFGEIAQAGSLYLNLQGDIAACWPPTQQAREFAEVHLWAAPGLLGSLFWRLKAAAQDDLDLWRDHANEQLRCQASVRYDIGDILFHVALGGQTEGFAIAGTASARIDRPLRITGAPLPVREIAVLNTVSRTAAGLKVALFGLTLTEAGLPLRNEQHRLSAKNGVLTCSAPEGMVLTGHLQGSSVDQGNFWLGIPAHQMLLTLPDPYVTSQDAPFAISGAAVVRVNWQDAGEKTKLSFGLQLKDVADAASKSPSAATTKSQTLATIMPHSLPTQDARALIDVSGLADYFGVHVHFGRTAEVASTTAGVASEVAIEAGMLAVAGKRMTVVTLPSISWEPMLALPLPVAEPPNPPDPEDYDLRIIGSGKEGDGTFDRVQVPTVNLVRIAPEIALHEYVQAVSSKKPFQARLNMPFGMVGWLKPQLPDTFAFNQPRFSDTLRGGLQLKLVPPNPASSRAVFNGFMELVGDVADLSTPPQPMGYGQKVLGRSVGYLFNREFGVDTPAVPLRRYDLSGRGASIFSDWRDENLEHPSNGSAPNPNGVGVVKSAFNVFMGRTGYEEIIVQAVIHPWGIKVRRTVTINRQQAGWMIRRDTGWVAVSDSLFFPFAKYDAAKNSFDDSFVHHGLIDKLTRVERIVEVSEPLLASMPDAQAVRFDATVLLTAHNDDPLDDSQCVKSGGFKVNGQEAIAAHEVWGFLKLDPTPPTPPDPPNATVPEAPPTAEALATFFSLFERSPARGKVACVIDIGGTGQLLRATQIEASPTLSPDGEGHIVLALAGSPVLSRAGAWSVTRRAQLDSQPQALAADFPVPVIQKNGNGLWHLADCRDVFALDGTKPLLPQNEYGLMQGTGTQKIYFPYPRFEGPTAGNPEGRLRIREGEDFKLADVRSLLRSTGLFPPGVETLLTELADGDLPKLGANGLAFDKTWTLSTSKVEPIIDTGPAKVMLRYANAKQDNGDIINDTGTTIKVHVDASSWSIEIGPLSFELHAMDQRLLAVSFSKIAASTTGTAKFSAPDLVLGATLKPIVELMKEIQNVTSHLPAAAKAPGSSSGLNVDFSDGVLSIGNSVTLPDLPLGFGTVKNIQFDIGGTLSFLPAKIDFGVGLGTEQNPMTLILSPFTGIAMVRLAVGNDGHRIIVRAGVGLALAIDVGIASGSCSITIAIQVEIGTNVRIAGILTGHAEVNVLGGLASAGLTLEAGAGISPDVPTPEYVRLDAYVAVGIHISICWIIDIDFDTSWPFQTDVAR